MGRAGAHERRQRLCRLGVHGSILGGFSLAAESSLLYSLPPGNCCAGAGVVKLAACSIQDTPCS